MNLRTAAASALPGVLLLTLLSGCKAGTADTLPGPAGSETVSASASASTSLTEPEVSQETPEASDQREESFSFSQLKHLQFTFSSGAGAWSTLLNVRADGSFSGIYYDSDMDIQYRCEFTGQFSQPVQVNDYTYSVEISQIEYANEVGAEEAKDGIHYIYSEPYGLSGAETLLIYPPGAPLSELPEYFVNWVASRILGPDGLPSLSDTTALPFYGLYNEAQQQGFSSYDMVEGLRSRLTSTQEQSDALQQSVLEGSALSQADMNSTYYEIYQLWDGLLNDVWQTLTQLLPPEEMEALTQEELEWIAWKEQEIAGAGTEYGGGSLQIMAQAQRSADVTRDRVYELMELLEAQ